MMRKMSAACTAAVAVWTAVAPTAAAAPSLDFAAIFTTAGEPARLHFRTTYLARGTPHTLEVWRDDHQVKRVTDGATTTYAIRAADGSDFTMTVVDPVKRVVTTIDRANLYRLGNFTDWFDLTHGLRHPKGLYVLTRAVAPRGVAPPSAACTWYDLTAATRTTHICWSRDAHIPLVIVGTDDTVFWRVTTIDHVAPPAIFRVADLGFVHVNANRDIDRD